MKIAVIDIDSSPSFSSTFLKKCWNYRKQGVILFAKTHYSYTYALQNCYKFANGYITNDGAYIHIGCCRVICDIPLAQEHISFIKDVISQDPHSASYQHAQHSETIYNILIQANPSEDIYKKLSQHFILSPISDTSFSLCNVALEDSIQKILMEYHISKEGLVIFSNTMQSNKYTILPNSAF